MESSIKILPAIIHLCFYDIKEISSLKYMRVNNILQFELEVIDPKLPNFFIWVYRVTASKFPVTLLRNQIAAL